MELEERNKHIQEIADQIQQEKLKPFMQSQMLLAAARSAVGVCVEIDVFDMKSELKRDYLAILAGARDVLVAPKGAQESVWPVIQ